ncbi:uncharacterized protein N7477_003048 [Penicillium maclennaniae]|uniref:uncharacterized protein n=1 Tax=Penicillium maclennaniae TaxID=1343394 RepID=UPI0025409291|nr:uncharacterized protein N7477_003048 [Penicillium maclennaniae]KAJ5677415.1 hypothetical protein N7477_003048 [Penicillium maclennaniae]
MIEEKTRLHIVPFTPELLPSVLPPSLRQSATDISFHTIPTFPENNYGYVTLPTMDAEKIKKKLNGSILKGKKFKVDHARPSKRQRDEEEAVEVPAEEKKKSKKRKSKDVEDEVIDGYELPSDRKVKRGWTEPSKKEKRRSEKKSKDAKKEKPQLKSKYTEKSECLFRTTLPPNRLSVDVEDKKAKKKKKSSRETVVHEFAKTYTQPSFLRSAGEDVPPTTTFDEEKGWVDSAGAVKESASEKTRKDNYRPGQVPGTKEKKPKKKIIPKEKTPEPSEESEDYTSSSGSDESSNSESEADSSSDDSSDSSDEETSKQLQLSKETEEPPKANAVDSDNADSEGPEAACEAARDADESSPKEIHPLEALFKRPAPASAAEQEPVPKVNAGFSFFGADDFESEDEPQIPEPQTPFTPFTKRDLQDRGLRSAAPTPDTSMVNRRLNWNENDEEEDEDSPIDTPVSKARDSGAPKDETEFAKWFWDNRGDNNRAWKKRRRDAAKEQRQRENRKKGMKGRS